MTDIIRSRIREALERAGMPATRAATEAGLSRMFLRDFLSGKARSIKTENLDRIARVLDVSSAWLAGDDSRMQAEPQAAARHDSQDVPVHGSAAGAITGNLSLSGDVVDWISRPPGLQGARDIYALYVTGESMQPLYRPGSLIFVHPHRPVRAGDIAIIQTEEKPGHILAWVKEFTRTDSEGIVTRQYNPPAEVRFPHKTIKAIHRVMSVNELFGV